MIKPVTMLTFVSLCLTECIQPKFTGEGHFDDEALLGDGPITKLTCDQDGDDEGHVILACPARSRIHVLQANYGRTQRGVCPHAT